MGDGGSGHLLPADSGWLVPEGRPRGDVGTGTKGVRVDACDARMGGAAQWKRRASYGTCGNRIGLLVCV